MTQGDHRGNSAGERDEAAQAASIVPAASMSLLNSLLANPLDAGYEHYRAEHGSRPASVGGKIAVFAVAVALGFGSIVATSSLRAPEGDVKSDLKSQASERTAAVEARMCSRWVGPLTSIPKRAQLRHRTRHRI